MAKVNDKGLVLKRYTHSDYWWGTADQLIEAGIIERHMLPGEPGRNKTCVTFGSPKGTRTFHYDGDYVNIQRVGKQRFSVHKHVSEEEEMRRKMRKIVQREKAGREDILEPVFKVGDVVDVYSEGRRHVATVYDLKWGSVEFLESISSHSSPEWLYMLTPNPSKNYSLHWQDALRRRPKADVLILPCALNVPVTQSRHRGALPKCITALRKYRYAWKKRRDRIDDLKYKIDLSERLIQHEDRNLTERLAELKEISNQRLDLI